ncbi:MAG: 23S rRNA (adenine(2503)-C(2))-methyltransferase RlmN [Coriobacteriia bacterium]|nr:23S rRNA (adenine(2503)-C(2))-methyltransferase RlmN [Coriobacteriia bacterium]
MTNNSQPTGRNATKREQPSIAIPASAGIKRYGITALQALMVSLGQPTYRADQLIEWLYGRSAESYDQMTNLPASLRDQLEQQQPIARPEVIDRQISSDGTRKYLLRYADGARIEAVGIPDRSRLTVCFSTQVGCSMGCTFCATGRNGLVRQLAPGEIVDQLTVVANDFGQNVNSAVAMGEGEPFANYSATLDALRLINHPKSLNIGARHLTISTSGVISGLMAFAAEPEQFRLAVSLHSARQQTRNMLMPRLTGYSINALQQTLLNYNLAVGRRVSLEYILIDEVTDTDAEIAALIAFCTELNCHINLIPVNAAGADPEFFVPTPLSRARAIRSRLLSAGIATSIRRSRGADIASACGQLAGS